MLALACESAPEREHDDEPAALELPELPWCDEVREWTDASSTRALELAIAIDDAREAGGRCGQLGIFVPSRPLATDGALTCAAREHAADMEARAYFGHADPDGDNAVARMRDAGYVADLSTELIAAGDVAAQTVIDLLWLPSDAHCAALLAPEWTRVGIAHHPSADEERGAFWVVVLATEPR